MYLAWRQTLGGIALVLAGASASVPIVAAAGGVCDPTMACCEGGGGGGSPCGGAAAATQGNESGTNDGAGNPINVITGNKFQREVDLPALPGVLGLEIVRYYNSAYSGLDSKNGIFGRGWRLGYESSLEVKPASLQITQSDGTPVTFKATSDGSLYRAASATQGYVGVQKKASGPEYTWFWANGRRLSFDGQGKLLQIAAPSGEFVSLQYDPRGWLVQVTDPQGRVLHLTYLDRKVAAADKANNQRFRGVQSIDSPVGRFAYEYGSNAPAGMAGSVDKVELLANLVKVALPTHYEPDQLAHPYANRGVSSSSVARLYHYENPLYPTLLTGITVAGQGSDGRQMLQRISTYGYDKFGRANLSVRGEPARLVTDATGKVLEPKRLAAGTGLEQVTLSWPAPGQTRLVNSLGQETLYRAELIAGRPRLLQVTGAGCASCGPSNMRYGYDQLGRLVEETRLANDGQAIEGQRSQLDEQGRTVRVERIVYRDGKAQAPEWLVRYDYGRDPEQTQPLLIARPSVIAGKEQQSELRYNDKGQQTSLTERGFSPIDDKGQPSPAGSPIIRTSTYSYASINGRSVLREIDGPLANEKTRIDWDASANFISTTTLPGDRVSRDEHDATTGRLVRRTDPAGLITRYEYDLAFQERPSLIERAGRSTRYSFDAQGRVVRVSDALGQDRSKPGGRSISLTYDSASHLIAITDGQGYKAQTTLDAEGQALVAGLYEPEQSLPLRATYRWYDGQRRITRQLRPDGRLDTWRYDSAGEVSEHVDGDEVLHLERSNPQGLQARIQLTPDGLMRASLQTGSDAAIQVPTAITSPRVEHDDFGRPVLEWRPEQGLKLRSYDAADHLAREDRLDRSAKPAGHIEQTFDVAGRLTRRLTYDAQGILKQTLQRQYQGAHLARESDDAQTSEYSYDAAGRIERTTITLKDDHGNAAYRTTLLTSYGASGEASAKTLADGQVMRIERSAETGVASRITLQSAFWSKAQERLNRWLPSSFAGTAQGWLPQTPIVQDIAFHPYNGITGYTQGNGIATHRDFDIAGRLTAIKVGNEQSTLTYGVGPRIRTLAEQSKDQAPIKASYDYDGFGALKTEGQARLIKTSLNAGPLLSATAVAPVERDERGRTTSDGTFHYAYTEDGQIDTVSKDGTRIAKYRYNTAGQRVSKTLGATAPGSTTTYYLWTSGKLVAEIEGSGDHRGDVTAQYLYLSDEGKAAPIAKLETVNAQGNATGRKRTLYVNSDYRGEPIAMTNEAQHVVWKAAADAWGYVKTQGLQGQEAVMNLRLPGQYLDAETGLHDNWHRSYDARPGSAMRGTYLTPDPIGYPDGDDPNLYVGGDPINRVDPTGLYEVDIHYYTTYFLAIGAGMTADDALTLALATQYVDDNPNTRPLPINLSSLLTQNKRLMQYHFTSWKFASDPYAPEQIVWNTSSDLSDPIGKSSPLQSLRSYAIPTQTCPKPMDNTSLQFMGEFLHPFEDAYGHRDQANVPIKAAGGIGHLFYGTNPDFTYNHVNVIPGQIPVIDRWQTNESRTIRMEMDAYVQIVDYMKATGRVPGKKMSMAVLQDTMQEFNGIKENEDNTKGFTEVSAKLKLLNKVLEENGFDKVPSYDVQMACQNRQKNLSGLEGSNYPSAILTTPSICATERPRF